MVIKSFVVFFDILIVLLTCSFRNYLFLMQIHLRSSEISQQFDIFDLFLNGPIWNTCWVLLEVPSQPVKTHRTVWLKTDGKLKRWSLDVCSFWVISLTGRTVGHGWLFPRQRVWRRKCGMNTGSTWMSSVPWWPQASGMVQSRVELLLQAVVVDGAKTTRGSLDSSSDASSQ